MYYPNYAQSYLWSRYTHILNALNTWTCHQYVARYRDNHPTIHTHTGQMKPLQLNWFNVFGLCETTRILWGIRTKTWCIYLSVWICTHLLSVAVFFYRAKKPRSLSISTIGVYCGLVHSHCSHSFPSVTCTKYLYKNLFLVVFLWSIG